MRRVRFFAVAGVLAAAVVAAAGLSADARQAGPWATIKGQVLFPADKPIPERKKLEVSQDKEHCLSKGPLLDEGVIVNPKSRGIKNVVVWLRPDNPDNPKAALAPNEIHPGDANRKPADVVIDQPCCVFEPRVTCARVGDTVVVKNPAAFVHNFFWVSENNGTFNVAVAANQQWRMPNPLVAEAGPIEYKCTIHSWMNGYVRVFDHPYFAVTDEHGKFEIKNAPAGKYRIVYWHERVGFKGGRAGRFGDVIEITDGGKGVMAMKPTDFAL